MLVVFKIIFPHSMANESILKQLLIHCVLDRPFDALAADLAPPAAALEPLTRGLVIDVTEDDKAYNINAEVPGMRKEDIKIKLVDNHTLMVSGEKEEEKKEEIEGGCVV